MTESDKNFDQLAERFARKVYGSIKGEIRLQVLWRDLVEAIPELSSDPVRPLRILDVGGGLGQFSVKLAQLGHVVIYNDLSENMAEQARMAARAVGIEQQIQWHIGPYQTLMQQLTPPFDLILCHAVLEWLARPEALIPSLNTLLSDSGMLSLCYYNAAAKVYRNLIRGNFSIIEQAHVPDSNQGSLTPKYPCSIDQVKTWLQQNDLELISETGIRVFSDYVIERRGGHLIPEEVLKMELQYSQLSPYKGLGRYQHILARRQAR